MKILLLLLLPLFGFAQNCEKLVEKKVDKFKDQIDWRTPLKYAVRGWKNKENDKVYTFLLLTAYAESLTLRQKGVYILFENGDKIIKEDEEVKGHVHTGRMGYRYEYRTIIDLTPEDIEKLTTLKITDFKLYIYENSLKPKDAETVMQAMRCLVDIH